MSRLAKAIALDILLKAAKDYKRREAAGQMSLFGAPGIAPPGKRAEKVPVKAKTGTYYGTRYKNPQEAQKERNPASESQDSGNIAAGASLSSSGVGAHKPAPREERTMQIKDYRGKTPSGKEFSLRVDGPVSRARVQISVPALGLQAETVCEEMHQPTRTQALVTVAQVTVAGKRQRMAMAITPEMRAWLDAAQAEIANAKQAEQAAQKEEKRQEKLALLAPVQAALPAGRLAAIFHHFQERPGSDGYGDEWYELADGRLVRWDASLGSLPASEERQGAFGYVRFMSIPEDSVDEAMVDIQRRAEEEYEQALATKREAARRKEADALAAAQAAAYQTGKEVLLDKYTSECDEPDCSMDIIYRYVQPDGSVRSKRVHTH